MVVRPTEIGHAGDNPRFGEIGLGPGGSISYEFSSGFQTSGV